MAYGYGDQVDFTTHEEGWNPGYGYGDQVDFTTKKEDWVPGYGYGDQVEFTTNPLITFIPRIITI